MLSHDVVEGWLMRRAGWGVIMAHGLDGSYEESPPTLMDNAARDARWCQGNLQHLALINAQGLHWINRLQILMAVMVYAAAPLWAAFLSIGVILRMQQGPPEAGEPWSSGGTEQLLSLHWSIVLTAVMLFGPKLMGAALILADPRERRGFGGAWRLLAGLGAELVMSAALAPLQMLSSCQAVANTLLGRDGGWRAQRRHVEETPWAEAWRAYGWQTGVGVALLAIIAPYSDLVIWMAPILLGLLGAVPIAALTASASIGANARDIGLFLTPDECLPPPLLGGVPVEEAAPEAPVDAEVAATYA